MSSETLTVPVTQRGPGIVASRLVRHFRAQVEDWYDECRQLVVWEKEHLVDDLRAASLTQHVQLLDELEQAGRWLSQATQSPDFPDRSTADLVAMVLQDLRDARAMWHGSKFSPEERDRILKACFNES